MSTRPPVVKADLSGKTVAVIGCNTGIGLEIAKHFAIMNPARVICGCRSQEKADATVSLVKEQTGYTAAEPWVIELSNFKSVVAFAERFEKEATPSGHLVYNAAVAFDVYRKTPDGWEEMLQVNHLSAGLLTLLLLPNLVRAAEKSGDLSRVTVVSSGTHAWAKFTENEIPGNILETLNDEAQGISTRYPQTKLLNVFFTRALAAHLPSNTPIIVDAACPGFCLSDLRRNMTDQSQFDQYMPEAKTSEEGSRSIIYAALGPQGATLDDLKKFHGGYVSEDKLAEAGEWVRTEEGQRAQEKVWKETVKIASGIAPVVSANVKKYASHW
ncbi:hypothetical protein QCA50_009683 [Cerrena zonata]|uniref:Uncharacterized protein n=1 Tax=Cerrena zonata TaxID=2478898 RepID=A0AAW0G660_9APHY